MSSNQQQQQQQQQLVCIRRPETGLSSRFEEMYLNERLVDVTLSCCDGQLQAHKLVLAACSPYFSGLFDKLVNPLQCPIIIVIKDMQFEDLKLMVDFMYRGQLTLSREKLMNLIKSAESLQVYGLSDANGIITNGNASGIESTSINETNSQRLSTPQRLKRHKKPITNTQSSLSSLVRSYQLRTDDANDDRNSTPTSEKLLDPTMINEGGTADSMDANNSHFQPYLSSSTNVDPASTRGLTNTQQQQLQTPSPSSMSLQHLTNSSNNLDSHQSQQQLNNQLQVLSHSLTANRSSLAFGTAGNSHHHQSNSNNNGNNNHHNQSLTQHSASRSRLHPCNICWKTFREKANLKRHLQVHSIDRIIYACHDCNKTFNWKDNFIRHTKTAHHMNNIRQSN